MRKTALLAASTLVPVIVLVSWWIVQRGNVEDEVLIPADALLYAAVNRFPADLEQMKGSRILDFLDLSEEDLENLRAEFDLTGIYAKVRGHVKRTWICIHGLRRKSSGSYRIEFSVWIQPVPGSRRLVRETALQAVLNRFGKRTSRVVHSPDAVIVRGRETGQVLYCKDLPATLYFSNSRTAWEEFNVRLKEEVRKLQDSSRFQSILRHLPENPDILVYFRGAGILPEFGYAAVFSENGVRDFYYSVEEEEILDRIQNSGF